MKHYTALKNNSQNLEVYPDRKKKLSEKNTNKL